MTRDFVRISLLDPEQGRQVKAACADLQDMLTHGKARAISQKEMEVDAWHAKVPEVVAYSVWKRFIDLLQTAFPAEATAITGFLVSPYAIEACIEEINRLAEDPDIKPVATLFQRASRDGKWLFQTVPQEDG